MLAAETGKPLWGGGSAVESDLYLQRGLLRQKGDHGQYGHCQASSWPEGQHKWTTLGVWTGVLAWGWHDPLLQPHCPLGTAGFFL